MILEVASLSIVPDGAADFEKAFEIAKTLIARQRGFLGLSLRKCLERPNVYILLVSWETMEDHTKGFRESLDYLEWKRLLHHFYDPFPIVEHYELVVGL